MSFVELHTKQNDLRKALSKSDQSRCSWPFETFNDIDRFTKDNYKRQNCDARSTFRLVHM